MAQAFAACQMEFKTYGLLFELVIRAYERTRFAMTANPPFERGRGISLEGGQLINTGQPRRQRVQLCNIYVLPDLFSIVGRCGAGYTLE